MRRYWNEIKRCIRLYRKRKDTEHLKDVWRLTKYYIGGKKDAC